MTPVGMYPGDQPLTQARVRAVLDRAGARIDWVDDGLDGIRRCKVGWVGHRKWTGQGLPPAVTLREQLGIYAQHRPVRPVPGLPSRHPDVDLLVVRETTEDVYAHLEHESIEGVYESVKVTTRAACERIARQTFRTARQQGRQRVTIAHKSNILKLSDGLFLRTAKEVAKEFPDLTCDDLIVDALCMRLVIDPSRFDVILCGNLYGDIIGDLCAGLVGGASNVPSIGHGDGLVVFGAGYGDGPTVDGTDRANPLPLLLPAVWLLRHVGAVGEAEALVEAIAKVLERGDRPFALGGSASCEEFCAAVEAML
jgi:isocitrate dehydrogenase (NAD+)